MSPSSSAGNKPCVSRRVSHPHLFLFRHRTTPTAARVARACQPGSFRHPRDWRSQRGPRDQCRRPEQQPDRVRESRRGRTAFAVSGVRQDLVRPRRRGPRNGDGRPATDAVRGARGCASRPAAAVQFRQARDGPRRQHTKIRVRDTGRHGDPVKYSDGSRMATARSFQRSCRRNFVGSRVLIRSDLSDHDRLPRLPGRPDVGRGTTRQTLVPRNIPTAIEQSGHGDRG